jgi:hypothetical protein
MRLPPVLLLYALCSLSGCVAAREPTPTAGRGPEGTRLVAVFPVENLSGRPAPLEGIRRMFAERLTGHGLRVLDDATLERAITGHRVRYTAGIERAFASALRQETGADAVLIPALELYDEALPPRVALFARLVTTGEEPAVLWIDGRGAAGDDSPGILGIGMIEDPRALLARAVETLSASLVRHLADGGDPAGPGPRRFRPKLVYRSGALDPARPYSIAIVPFFNKSARRHGGEIIALHMMRHLAATPNLTVVEPGIVREELLRFRIIMSDGISLSDTETILNAVNADLVLNGEVLEYQDRSWVGGAPLADFGVLFLERKTRRVVYSSYSHNSGDDRVFFFDWGKVNTAHAMVSRMVQAISRQLLAPVAGEAPRGAQGKEQR